MCGRPGKIWQVTGGELAGLGLGGTTERIPLFTEVLSLVDGRVPIIVEIKSSPLRRELCQAVADMLDTYAGRFCVESFDPLIVGWFRRHRPGVLRGQLAGRGGSGSLWSRMQWFVLRFLLVDVVGRPHFIAYRVSDMDNLSYRLCRRLGALTVGWTVRGGAGWATGASRCDAVIFETWEGMPDMGGGERAAP
jgi:glycerophosphoryl diester phosphodiesterase